MASWSYKSSRFYPSYVILDTLKKEDSLPKKQLIASLFQKMSAKNHFPTKNA